MRGVVLRRLPWTRDHLEFERGRGVFGIATAIPSGRTHGFADLRAHWRRADHVRGARPVAQRTVDIQGLRNDETRLASRLWSRVYNTRNGGRRTDRQSRLCLPDPSCSIRENPRRRAGDEPTCPAPRHGRAPIVFAKARAPKAVEGNPE